MTAPRVFIACHLRTAFLVLPFLLLAVGCSSVSPRYRSPAHPPPSPIEEDEVLAADRVRAEEQREDDRKVDPERIQAGLGIPSDSAVGESDMSRRDRVLLDVVGFLGTPYRFGGATKDGLDCSGFTARVFESALNIRLPRSTREQYSIGADIGRADLQFGDLVFFNTTGRSPSHVGIFIEEDLFAHASVSYGVTFSSLESTYYRKRFVGARRVAGTAVDPAAPLPVRR